MLSDLMARQAKATGKPYLLADFDGLYLYVSAIGSKVWHFRYSWIGKRERITFGGYPARSLKQARDLRDEARALLAQNINPRSERERKRHVIVLAGEHPFLAVYEKWLAHRSLHLVTEGCQSTQNQIERVFKKDVFPVLRNLTIYDVTRAHLLTIIGKVEKRGSMSVAEKLRTWFTQLFTYASVVVPNLGDNPTQDLDVVAMPLPPVENNPFLRMSALPMMLQTLRKYPGRLNTQLGLRLLLLTGVRTGELRYATPEQFDLDRGLWTIPVIRLKQRKQLTKKKRQRFTDIPPYIVPLSLQAQEIVRYLLENLKVHRGIPWKTGQRLSTLMPEATAIRRLHCSTTRHATVVVDPIGRQVLWIGQGRSRQTARAFFQQLPAGVAERIEAVAIDMTTAYELEIKAHCPQAEIVYDLFHVMAKYGREVIDRVRVDQANQLRHDRPARKVLKSSRWLLLRNRHSLDQRQSVHLKELLQANQPLLCVYVLRNELKRLWFYRKPAWAQKAWQQWMEQARQSSVAALQQFAERLHSYWPGIVSRCRHALNTSIVEGINNTIKVIKRRAYGYRDEDYFFLKIRAASPGIPR